MDAIGGNNQAIFNRALYLSLRHKVFVPTAIQKHIPAGEWLGKVVRSPATTDANGQVELMYDAGSKLGDGSVEELQEIFGTLLDEHLDVDAISWQEKSAIYLALSEVQITGLVEHVEFDLGSVKDVKEIPKFDTGFAPFDIATRGAYQGIFYIMGKPGVGKTSLALLMQGLIAKDNRANSTLHVQTEIPGAVIMGRAKPLLDKGWFRPGQDKLITSSWTASNILDWMMDNPDPDRVIFYDSPDAVTFGGGDGTRHLITKTWMDFVRMKTLCKAIFVFGWPRRADRVLTMESGAEGSAKERLSDCVMGIETFGSRKLKITSFKNRFGPKGDVVHFTFDYGQFEYECDTSTEDLDW